MYIVHGVDEINRRLRRALTYSLCADISALGRARLAIHALRGGARRAGPGKVLSLYVGRALLRLDSSSQADFDVLREIFYRGEYEADYRDVVVLDLGAHKGCFAAYALRRGANVVFAYEPAPDNFSFLRELSCSLTGHSVIPFNEAVAAASGTGELCITEQSWSHSLIPRSDRTVQRVEVVRTVALEEVIERANAVASGRKVILKMDIEGAEGDAIANTSTRALRTIHEIFVEVHNHIADGALAITQRLAESGFTIVSDDGATLIHAVGQ